MKKELYIWDMKNTQTHNKMHSTIQDRLSPEWVSKHQAWVVFYYNDERVTITRASRGYRLSVGGLEIWKSSVSGLCNWIERAL